MKAKQPTRRDVSELRAPIELSNRSVISGVAGYVFLICPICFTGFSRKASEAKRHAVSYCSKACAGYSCRRQVEVSCINCGKPYTVKKCHVGVVTCCGEECRRAVSSKKTTAFNIAGWESGKFPVGEKSWLSKLTEVQAMEIHADNRPHAEIAKDYGLTRAAISHLKRGDTWSGLASDKRR